eukprot:1149435-Pelagomonas_calceolata.AAC.10
MEGMLVQGSVLEPDMSGNVCECVYVCVCACARVCKHACVYVHVCLSNGLQAEAGSQSHKAAGRRECSMQRVALKMVSAHL